jgi:hypothetical protein
MWVVLRWADFWRSMLDFANSCVTVLASVVGVRRTSEERRKASNNEPMKLTKSRSEGIPASVVPAGRTCYGTDFPGTSSLANFRCRFATLPNRGREAGAGGKRWSGMCVNLGKGGQETGEWRSFSHFETALTHLFPHKSTQVVDFPRIEHVRLFWEGHEIGFSPGWGKKTEPRRHGGTEPREAELA